MRSLFTLAIFLSASLLFLVQPLIGRILLPVLGGSPAVWSVCVLFFQAALLLGYLYAHALSTRVTGRYQGLVHGAVLIGASIMLPLSIEMGSQPAIRSGGCSGPSRLRSVCRSLLWLLRRH